MVDCFRCGMSINSSDMLECVHSTGIVDVCKNCYHKLRIPIVEKKIVNWENVEARTSVRDKLSNMARVNVEEKKINILKKKNPEDVTLRDIVEKNFNKNKVIAKEIPNELIENFHWTIMRKRRAMKVTILELAEKISEPESVLISLEKGILPRDYSGLIKKIESYLGIYLYKEVKKEIKTEDILVESKIPTGLLVSDIKEKSKGFMNWFKRKPVIELEKHLDEEIIDAKDLNLEKIEEVFGKPIFEEDSYKKKAETRFPFENKKEIKSSDKKNAGDLEERELTQEEIDSLIWRN